MRACFRVLSQQLCELYAVASHADKLLAKHAGNVPLPTPIEVRVQDLAELSVFGVDQRRALTTCDEMTSLEQLRRVLLSLRYGAGVPDDWLCVAISAMGYKDRIKCVPRFPRACCLL